MIALNVSVGVALEQRRREGATLARCVDRRGGM